MTEDSRASDLGSHAHASLPQFLDDQPCRDPDKMRFGHDVYIAAIRDTVASCPTPFTIGLYGKWGTGKTTVLEGLRSALHKQSHLGREFKVCLFDAWKYSKEASFRRQFLAELNRQLNLGWDLDSLLYRPKEDFKLHWGALGPNLLIVLGVFAILCALAFGVYWAASRIGAGELANTFLSATVASMMTIVLFVVGIVFDFVRISSYRVTHPLIFAPEQFEEQFTSMLKKAKVNDESRLVVLIDNLDRCAAEAAVGALRTIKTFLEHKGCVFVVACDEGALIRHLGGDRARGHSSEEAKPHAKDQAEADAKEFLRKFFQTTVLVEPLLDDLRDFASELVEAAGLQAEVAVVVWAATPRDPRRILQFLNRLTMALKVVEARERSGRLAPSVVSENQAYLAKIQWAAEQWSEFVRDCFTYPDLLRLFDQAIVYPDRVSDHPRFATYLGPGAREGRYASLHQFMEATIPIRADDPLPFLALQMSALEMGITDAPAFRERLRQGQAEEIAADISQVSDPAELARRKEVMVRMIEQELGRGREVDALQVSRVAVRCFSLLPEPRRYLAHTICRAIRAADPKSDIPTFHQRSLLVCLGSASRPLAQAPTEKLLESLDPGSLHTGEFFAALSEHDRLLDSAGWSALGKFLLATLSSEPETALQYLGAIEPESAVATALFAEKPDILTQLAGMVTRPALDLAGKALDTVGRFTAHADASSMNQLAVDIGRLINVPPEERLDGYTERTLRALGHLDVLKMSAEYADQLHAALHRALEEPRAHQEAAQFLTHDLRIYTLESEHAQQQTLQTVKAFVGSWPADKLSLLGEVIWEADVELAKAAFVDAATARASDPQRSAEEIQHVLAALTAISPDTKSLALSSALAHMLERPERPMKELGAKNIATYADRFPPASLQELVKAVHREYMTLPAAESGPMASHLLQLTDKRSPGNIRNTFADRLKTEMVHENPPVRRAAAQHYDELRRRARLSQDTRKAVAKDVADGLYALRQTLAVEDRPLFDLLLEEQDKPKILKDTWTSLGNTIESLLHSDHAPPVRRMACQLVTQFHTLPAILHDGIREQLEMIAADETLPQEIRDDASSAIRGLGQAAE